MHRKFTSAILLIVESVLLDNLNSALAQAPFAPVLRPKGHLWHLRLGKMPCFFNLLQALPTTRSQRSGDDRKAMLFGIFRSSQKPKLKTFQTSWASLGFLFQTIHFLQPLSMIVIIVNNLQAQRLRITGTFVFSNLILLQRIDIWIVIINGRRNTMLHHTLDDGRRTRRAACVEQHFSRSAWGYYFKRLFHNAKIKKVSLQRNQSNKNEKANPHCHHSPACHSGNGSRKLLLGVLHRQKQHPI